MAYSAKLSLGAIALTGFYMVLIMTRWGIGISPDSVNYIAGARSIVDGHGFSVPSELGVYQPIAHRSPLYSLLLASVGFIGVDAIVAARWLNATLFALNLLLISFLVLSQYVAPIRVNRVIWSILAGWVALTASVMLEMHGMAWTEPLFIFLGFSGIYLLSRYLQGSGYRFLIGSAILIALSALTRYAGIVWIAAGSLAVLWIDTKPVQARIKTTIQFAAISILPLIAWLLRNYWVAGSMTERELFVHPVNLTHARLALTTVASWFLLPEAASGWLKLIVLLICAVLMFFGLFLWRELTFLVKIISLFIPLYLLFLAFSISLLDANTPLDNRILSPVFVGVLILVILSLANLTERLKWNWNQSAISLGIAIIIGLVSALPVPTRVVAASRDGLGFNNVKWRSSDLLTFVDALPADSLIYSNAPEAIYIQKERVAQRLPAKTQSANLQPNPEYRVGLSLIETRLRSGGGVILYFYDMPKSTLPKLEELIQALKLRIVYQASDGVVLAP